MSKQVIELKVGMLGWSAEAISNGASGWCWFPVGKEDPTRMGGREWVKLKVTAIEDVRSERDVIVADDLRNVKEHTPVELSYERLAGGFQRVTEQFPLPDIPYFDKAGSAQKVGLTEPFPVTAGSKAILHVTIQATVLGNTQIIAPAEGKKIRVHWYSISNTHAVMVDVGMRFAEGGDIKHRHGLGAQGGSVVANLIDATWEGAVDEILYANLAAAYVGGVYFNIGYTEE